MSEISRDLEQKPHCCPDCQQTFGTSRELAKHRKNHKEEQGYQCTLCGSCFSRRAALKKHSRACSLADPSLKSEDESDVHCKDELDLKNQSDVDCMNASDLKNQSDVDCMDASDFKDESDVDCKDGSDFKDESDVHCKVGSDYNPRMLTLPSAQLRGGQCERKSVKNRPDVSFKDRSDFKTGSDSEITVTFENNLKWKKQRKKRKKDITKETPQTTENEKTKPRGRPRGRPKKEKESKTFSCSECPMSFPLMSRLKEHMRTHTGERPFMCSVCPSAFSQSSDLTRHLRTHSGERPYHCKECPAAFATSYKLTMHTRIHTGEKPYRCAFCPGAFARRTELTMHERTHTGYKPHLCSQCAKSFTTAAKLKMHSRTHTGEKPYTCTQCSAAFARRTDLTMHERTHTGNKPHLCSECAMSFTTTSKLKRHSRVHTGEKPYQCPICFAIFSQSSGLNKHMKKRHRDQMDSLPKPGLKLPLDQERFPPVISSEGKNQLVADQNADPFHPTVPSTQLSGGHSGAKWVDEMPVTTATGVRGYSIDNSPSPGLLPNSFSNNSASNRQVGRVPLSQALADLPAVAFSFLHSNAQHSTHFSARHSEAQGIERNVTDSQSHSVAQHVYSPSRTEGVYNPSASADIGREGVKGSATACNSAGTGPADMADGCRRGGADAFPANISDTSHQQSSLTSSDTYHNNIMTHGNSNVNDTCCGNLTACAADNTESVKPFTAIPPSAQSSGGWYGSERVKPVSPSEPSAHQGMDLFSPRHPSTQLSGGMSGGKRANSPSAAEVEAGLQEKTKNTKTLSTDASASEGSIQRPYYCLVCQQAFTTSSELVTHSKTHTEKNVTADKAKLQPESGKRETSDAQVKIKSGETQTEEKKVDVMENVRENGKKTKKGKSKTKSNAVKDEKRFLCSECPLTFPLMSWLKKHMRTHTGEKPFLCSLCPLAFSSSPGLTRHYRTHSGEKPYSCTSCDAAFSTSWKLRMHVRTHTGEKPNKCVYCPAAFARRTDLIMHERTHTGTKPHQCAECGKAFTTTSKLKRHSRVHTGEKPYECPICFASFSQSSGLNKHTKRRHKMADKDALS